MSKGSKILQPPVGIIIAHPARFFEEYDEKRYVRAFELMNTKPEQVWYRAMKNPPTQDFLYIYTCYAGKLQHRTNSGGILRNTTKTFSRPEGGSRTFENTNFLVHCGPYVKCPVEIPMKGFQGFKYVYEELW